MRQLIIDSFEKLVWALIVLIIIGAVIGGIGMMFSPVGPGFIGGLLLIIGGILYAIVIGGMMFLFIGIHENTKKTVEQLERITKFG